MNMYRVLCCAAVFSFACGSAKADPFLNMLFGDQSESYGDCATVSYGEKGFQYKAIDCDTDLWLGFRFQNRYDSFSGNLDEVQDLLKDRAGLTRLRRGRIKGGGKLFWDWLDVYSEYNFPTDTLLDFRATVTLFDKIHVRGGQWKSEFTRERVDSSGKQQFVERSISTLWFTIDRQMGVSVATRLAEETSADTSIWLEYLSGQGRGGNFERNSGLFLGRFQWNPAGEVLPFSQSDLKRREDPLPSIALAVVSGRTPFTRFSSSGGRNLPGFKNSDYDLNQLLFETALHYQGFSWQQELHWKNVEDRFTGQVTRMIGGYGQIGTFPSEWCSCVPEPLEIMGRLAIVDPDRAINRNTEYEWTAGANWFFNGHRNKLTTDISWLDFKSPTREASQWRWRIQWEFSI